MIKKNIIKSQKKLTEERSEVKEEINPQKEREELGKEKPKSKDTVRLIWASKPKKEPAAKDLDFQTAEEVYPNKEDTHEHYQDQLNIYAWLLEKLEHKVEDFAYLLFYHPKEVLETGEVVFNTDLKKMKISPDDAEKLFNKAIKMLNGDCPTKCCEWCEGR